MQRTSYFSGFPLFIHLFSYTKRIRIYLYYSMQTRAINVNFIYPVEVCLNQFLTAIAAILVAKLNLCYALLLEFKLVVYNVLCIPIISL